MSDIFISYASEDKGRVQALAHALENKGWSVWWDRRIPAGKSFDEVIHEALKSARSVVVVWTRASIKSTWVKNESRSGLRRNILFPVMLLDEVEIPLEFEHLQAAHLMDWQPDEAHPGFDQFIDDLAGVIGAPPKTIDFPTLPTGQPSQLKIPQDPPSAPTSPKVVSSSFPVSTAQMEPVSDAHGARNKLSALIVSSGSLSPAFSANIFNYTVNVASDLTSVNLSATKADPNAMISGDVSAGAGIATGERTIQLGGPGTTTGVTIWVTAPGGRQKTYTVNVSRATLSGNNDLQSLGVSPGTLSPAFSANRIFYMLHVDGNVSCITVTPTLHDTNATLTVNGQGTGSGQAHSVTLAPAGTSTEIEIIVTAPNGSDKTYLMTVSRAAFPRSAGVEPEPERREPEPSAATAGAVNSNAPTEPLGSQGVTGVGQEPPQAGQDSLGDSIGMTQSTKSFPYLPIGIGALAVMGALVYFLFVPQGSPPVTRNVVPYEPPVQAPSPRAEEITPAPASESKPKQRPVSPTQPKPTGKREVTADELENKEGTASESKKQLLQDAKTLQLAQGMKPAKVLKILGEPSQVQQVDGHVVWKYPPQEYWKGYVPHYLVFDGTGEKLQSWYVDEQEYQQQQHKQSAGKTSGPASDQSDCAKKYRFYEDRMCYCYNVC